MAYIIQSQPMNPNSLINVLERSLYLGTQGILIPDPGADSSLFLFSISERDQVQKSTDLGGTVTILELLLHLPVLCLTWISILPVTQPSVYWHGQAFPIITYGNLC